jgi:predicted transcriptional regulator
MRTLQCRNQGAAPIITYEVRTENNSDKKLHERSYSKSKLELNVHILNILVYTDSMNLGLIMQQTDSSYTVTLENLNLLVRLKLIEERTEKHELVYTITRQGTKVTRFFKKTVSACLP